MNTTCAFCTIPELREREIIGNQHAWAFPTQMPIVPGHILIAPRRCALKYGYLTLEERNAIEEVRIHIVRGLEITFKAEGFNFSWNDGAVAGQTVPHFHLHVVPRKKGDAGIHQYEPREFLYRPGERAPTPEAELREIAKLIRSNL